VTKDREREAFDLLDRLIGTNHEKVSLGVVPAVNHPNVRGERNYFSKSGQEVSTSYTEALQKAGCPIRQAAGAIRLHHEDTAIVIGSRLANTYAEHYLGAADKPADAVQTIRDTRGARARPKWTFYSDPAAPPVEVVQWGKSWFSRSSILAECDRDGRTFSAPERLHRASGKKYRDGDYLLIHVLPRFGANDPQRVVIFEGLHRNGTRAAGLICAKPPLEDLRALAKEVGANPYYQALFKVETRVDADGEAHPIGVKLWDDPFPMEFTS